MLKENNMLTKEAIRRLNTGDVTVRLWNGSFNKAKVTAEFSRHKFELVVEKSHPKLAWMNGGKERSSVSLTYWKGCNGVIIPVPEELSPLVAKLKEAATMTDDYAKKLSDEGKGIANEFMSLMGKPPLFS